MLSQMGREPSLLQLFIHSSTDEMYLFGLTPTHLGVSVGLLRKVMTSLSRSNRKGLDRGIEVLIKPLEA